ncbi:ribosomal RNA-processing protein 8 [Coccinella septempunctata]|uniref:ribosomal RNA-processing protein 8 n=1 Tax=Coccinella septempunctata TaxID=41139 RepID=UPI001D079F02|nr:ribosomal RNA-processing protein 8 [Coccinella septempunctata]
MKNSKSNKEISSTPIKNEMHKGQKKLKKIKKNLPNIKHLKSMLETKLSNEEDKKMLCEEESNQTISEKVETKSKKKLKKRKLEKLKNDLNVKIESDIVKVTNKKNKKKKKLSLENISKDCNLNDTFDSNNADCNNLVQKNGRKSSKNLSLRERMLAKLKASRFRYLNEQLYCSPSKDAQNLFKTDPDAFKAYHEGFRQQVDRWPVNPVDVIIKSLKKMNKTYVIADFGCGDAKIAQEVQQKVHSFDLVATNDRVTECDMAKVPLSKESVDVAIFCLSLMGTNLQDYLKEANRVLKVGGILKIAEVESRIDNVDEFIKAVQCFGFQNTYKDLTHNIFYFMDFKKVTNVKKTKGLPTLSLNPCLYKKR